GVEPLPRRLLPELSMGDALHESWQSLLKRAARLNPLLRLTAKRAALIFAQTPATRDYLPRYAQKKTRILPAIGFSVDVDDTGSADSTGCQRATNSRTHSGLHVLSVGRLIHIKGFALGLKAFAVLSQRMPDCTYTIIGDGPKKRALQRLAERLDIDERVRFCGGLPHAEVLETMQAADVLLQPSFRDPPASSVMEAMAMGTPVVCLDSGGPAWQVTAETGIKVAVSTPDRTVSGLAAALIDLAQNAALRSALGRAAQHRVREHCDWEAKGQQVNEMYHEIRRQIIHQKVRKTGHQTMSQTV
ncbi:MAG: glycosyltransferase family 4 protein, partial [Lysobacterales bacterium]